MESPYKNLVISGGAVAGISFVGILDFLMETGHLESTKLSTYCGTSIGAIISFLLSIGYRPTDIKNFFVNVDFMDMLELTAEKLLGVIDNFGMEDGGKIRKVLQLFLEKKGFNKNITMSELHEKTGKKLIITLACLNTMKPEYVSYLNFPNTKVLDILIATVSIPYLFKPMIINDKYYVDGGIVKAFPIEIFRNEKESTFGIKLNNYNRFMNMKKSDNISERLINFKNYMIHISMIPTEYTCRISKDMNYIKVNLPGDPLKFENDKETRLGYFNYGRELAGKYLKKKKVNINDE